MVRLQADEHAERSARHLRVALGSIGAGLERFGQEHSPLLGIVLHLVHAEGDRSPDLGRELAHPRHLHRSLDHVQPVGSGGRQLEHTGTGIAQGVPQCEQLVVGGERTGDGLAVHGPVPEHP